MKPSFYQWAVAVASQFSAFSVGASMGYPGVLLYQLKMKDSDIPLNLDVASWIGSLHGLAGVLGIIAPVITQWRGRKFTYIAACLILIIGWILVYMANGLTMILISETLHGFGSNVLMTVSFDCLSEMITPVYRNVAVQSFGIVSGIGIAVVGVMTKFVHWRQLSVIMCIPAIIGVLISFTWLESPLWLAYKGDLDSCKINFTKIRGTDENSVKELREVTDANTHRINKDKTLKEDSIRRLWRQVTRRDFIMPVLHIFLLLNHSYWSGSFVILFYSIELISKTTHNENAAVVGGIIINLTLVIGTTLSNVLIKFYNNKSVLLTSTCCASACLFCVTIIIYLQEVGVLPKNSLLSLYFLVGYMISCTLGQLLVVLTMAAELLPVKHRGIGGVFFVISSCWTHGSSLKISPYLFAYLGLWGTFLIFTLNSIICGLLIWKYVPETKRKTLQEIENFYEHGTFEITLRSNERSDLLG